MINILLAPILASAAAPATLLPLTEGKHCEWPQQLPAAGGKAEFKRLNDLPDANMVMAVVRMKDGCLDPLIKATAIGRKNAAGRR